MTPDWLQKLFDEHDTENARLAQAERQRERVTKRNEPAGLIYKTCVTPPQPVQQQQSVAAMSPEMEKRWHEYVDGRINLKWNEELSKFILSALERFAKELGKEFAIERNRVRSEVAANKKGTNRGDQSLASGSSNRSCSAQASPQPPELFAGARS
jgi:hypothetical protein